METCPDCKTHKVYILGFVMVLTLIITAFVIFDYIGKASSIDEYNKLASECHQKLREANTQIILCDSARKGDGVNPLLFQDCNRSEAG